MKLFFWNEFDRKCLEFIIEEHCFRKSALETVREILNCCVFHSLTYTHYKNKLHCILIMLIKYRKDINEEIWKIF